MKYGYGKPRYLTSEEALKAIKAMELMLPRLRDDKLKEVEDEIGKMQIHYLHLKLREDKEEFRQRMASMSVEEFAKYLEKGADFSETPPEFEKNPPVESDSHGANFWQTAYDEELKKREAE